VESRNARRNLSHQLRGPRTESLSSTLRLFPDRPRYIVTRIVTPPHYGEADRDLEEHRAYRRKRSRVAIALLQVAGRAAPTRGGRGGAIGGHLTGSRCRYNREVNSSTPEELFPREGLMAFRSDRAFRCPPTRVWSRPTFVPTSDWCVSEATHDRRPARPEEAAMINTVMLSSPVRPAWLRGRRMAMAAVIALGVVTPAVSAQETPAHVAVGRAPAFIARTEFNSLCTSSASFAPLISQTFRQGGLLPNSVLVTLDCTESQRC
jgi:hypothetical protein